MLGLRVLVRRIQRFWAECVRLHKALGVEDVFLVEIMGCFTLATIFPFLGTLEKWQYT